MKNIILNFHADVLKKYDNGSNYSGASRQIKIRPHGFRNKCCRNHVPCFLVQKSDITMEVVLKK